MRKLSFVAISVFALTAVLSACSGSGTSSSTPYDPSKNPAKVQGVLHAKNVNKVSVYAVPIDAQGQPMQYDSGGIIGKEGITNEAGEFNSEFDNDYVNKPGIVLAFPEGTDKEGSLRYSAAIGVILFDQFGKGSKMRINVNWITSLASDFAYSSYIDENGIQTSQPNKHMPGIYTAYTIERANLWLGKQFNLSDIVSVTPILPNQLASAASLSSQERAESIRYGALVAAGIQLAGNDEKAWFAQVRDQQRGLLGQLYKNAGDNEFSLCTLYTEAARLLKENITAKSPVEANAELVQLEQKKKGFCQASPYEQTTIDVPFSEIAGWVNAAEQAKEFLGDLNQRLSNLTGETPINGTTTCDWSMEFNTNENCTASYFDPDYVQETKQFHGDLLSFYQDKKTEFEKAERAIRDNVLEFTACLNGGTGASCTGFSAAADKTPASYKKGDLTFTYEPDDSVKVSDKYHAFNFYVTGSQTVAGSTISYKEREIKEEGKDTVTLRPRLRVVYDDAFAKPPLTVIAQQNNKKLSDENFPQGAVEPLGFDYEFPKLSITNFSGNTLETYLAYKLIGVKPHPFNKSTNDYPYHYNYTQLVMQNDIDVNGDSKSKANINIVIKTSNGANFYAENVWPNLEDLFDNQGGASFYSDKKAGADILDPSYDTKENLFTYSLKQDQKIVLAYICADGKAFDENTFLCSDKKTEPKPSYTQADYFEITPQGLPTNRYELYKGEQSGTPFKSLRACIIPQGTNDAEIEQKKLCTESQEVFHEFELFTNEDGDEDDDSEKNTLFEKEKNGNYKYFNLFAVPGYGAYEPEFPSTLTWEENKTMDGKRSITYSQGLEDFSLLVDQKFKDKAPAIAKITFSKNTPTSWELAASLGYDYDEDARDALEQWGLFMEQGLVAAGDNAQSLYFSYFVNDDIQKDKTDYTELSSLVIFRGGVKFSGADKAEATGIVLAGNNKYSVEDGDTKGCGYLFADERKSYNSIEDSCAGNEVAYLSFRQTLIAVVREEKEDQFVARFSDGAAIELNFMQSLPKFFLDGFNQKSE